MNATANHTEVLHSLELLSKSDSEVVVTQIINGYAHKLSAGGSNILEADVAIYMVKIAISLATDLGVDVTFRVKRR